MKLIEAVKEMKGGPARIPDCSRLDLPEFFKQMGCRRGAEIGVYKAGLTEEFCKAGIHMYAIDPWIAYPGAGRTQQAQSRQDFLYSHAQRVLSPYPNHTIIRKTSMDALPLFKDNSLDFVYIDGDHSFRYVADDICEWSKKVKRGGIVSGHDYFDTRVGATNLICHVASVVDAYTKVFGIDNWFIFGKMKEGEEKSKDDKYYSWMWIKK